MTQTPKSSESECFSINGMHCKSCEIRLERALKKLPGVTGVEASHTRGEVSVRRTGEAVTDAQIDAIIRAQGYSTEAGPALAGVSNTRSWQILVGSLAIAVGLLWLLDRLHLTSLAPSATQGLGLTGALVIGLVAGTSSCLAVVGGLILALASRWNEDSQKPLFQRLEPLLQFNIGRLLAYFFLGGAIGFIGHSVGFGVTSTAVLTIVVALVMFWLGLSQLGLSSSLPLPSLPKSISHRIAALSDSPHPAAPFALGALTFFLPCGFTQSMQLVALASGNFMTGGMLMFFFALGTMPALLGLSVLSTLSTGRFSLILKTTTGMLVVALAVLNLESGLTLLGVPVQLPFLSHSLDVTALGNADGSEQEVSMTVTPYGTYQPDVLTVKAGIPVKWIIDGTNAEGCTNGIVMPALGIRQDLTHGQNIIEFTPPSPGTLAFSCSMGMVRGSFHVI